MWSQEDPRQGIKPVQPADAAAGNRRASDGSEPRTAQLGRSISLKGEVTGSEDMTVDGQVEGRIDLPDHVLTVGPNATILADVTATGVTIFGTVYGSITARDKVDVRKGGSVEGSVVCGRLAVQEGAYLSGKIETRGDRKSAKARTAATGAAAPPALAPVA
jgi:cytoskeletal protein CcmA (bactofilin family)